MNSVKAIQITELLKRAYPEAKCSLDFRNPLQLAISTILSAQSTDIRVNQTTPALFKKYKTVDDFASAKQTELENLIKSVGLYRNKAKNIIAFAKAVISDHQSAVPTTLHELQKLPGVGRKTANVIQGVLCDKAEGIAVDTHVTRLSFRLGFTKSGGAKFPLRKGGQGDVLLREVERHPPKSPFVKGDFTAKGDPAKIEKDLMKWIKPKDWALISHLLIHHGRATCAARNPKCNDCFLSKLCPRRGVKK